MFACFLVNPELVKLSQSQFPLLTYHQSYEDLTVPSNLPFGWIIMNLNSMIKCRYVVFKLGF